MHDIEDVFMLCLDVDIDLLALLLERLLQLYEIDLARADLRNHDHVEETIHDILIDIEDVDIILGKDLADHRDDADAVLTNNSYYEFHLHILLTVYCPKV